MAKRKSKKTSRGKGVKLSTEEKWTAFIIIIIFLGFLYFMLGF